MPSDLQVTNLRANDGTAGLVIANSTGNVSIGNLSLSGNLTGGNLTGQSVFKGFAVFDGTSGTPSALASFNVSSITRIATGAYSIFWDTDFANTNYYLLTTASNTDATACRLAIPRVVATDKVEINVMNNSASATDGAEHITVLAFT